MHGGRPARIREATERDNRAPKRASHAPYGAHLRAPTGGRAKTFCVIPFRNGPRLRPSPAALFRGHRRVRQLPRGRRAAARLAAAAQPAGEGTRGRAGRPALRPAVLGGGAHAGGEDRARPRERDPSRRRRARDGRRPGAGPVAPADPDRDDGGDHRPRRRATRPRLAALAARHRVRRGDRVQPRPGSRAQGGAARFRAGGLSRRPDGPGDARSARKPAGGGAAVAAPPGEARARVAARRDGPAALLDSPLPPSRLPRLLHALLPRDRLPAEDDRRGTGPAADARSASPRARAGRPPTAQRSRRGCAAWPTGRSWRARTSRSAWWRPGASPTKTGASPCSLAARRTC